MSNLVKLAKCFFFFLFYCHHCFASLAKLQPEHISEQLMYTTAKIRRDDGGSGTGFFFKFEDRDSSLTLVTNRHVIDESNSFEITLHGLSTERQQTKTGPVEVNVPQGKTSFFCINSEWIFHPNPEIDLAMLVIELESVKHPFFYRSLSRALMPKTDTLRGLSAIENITMVGYPNGISDEVNNFPIFRRGITASHPAVAFNGREEFLIDMACFTGSSGSPVFVYDGPGYADKRGNIIMNGQPKVFFMGILRAAPCMTVEGAIVVKDIPTSFQPIPEIQTMLHLGYVIKATEIEGFRSILEQREGIALEPVAQSFTRSSSSSSSSSSSEVATRAGWKSKWYMDGQGRRPSPPGDTPYDYSVGPNHSKHHIIPFPNLRFLWDYVDKIMNPDDRIPDFESLNKTEKQRATQEHFENYRQTYKLLLQNICPSHFTEDNFCWAPWNLFKGPLNRSDDPKLFGGIRMDFSEKNKPNSFDQELWDSVKALNRAIETLKKSGIDSKENHNTLKVTLEAINNCWLKLQKSKNHLFFPLSFNAGDWNFNGEQYSIKIN